MSKTISWHDLDKKIGGLKTDAQHDIFVKREAIPIIFVPGIMGSRLERQGDNLQWYEEGLPTTRWNPGTSGKAAAWMAYYYLGTNAGYRKSMLVGDEFKSSYLRVIRQNEGNGFFGIMADYRHFLQDLTREDWGPAADVFFLPVYAFGYNWTGTVQDAGVDLAARIKDVIAKAKEVCGVCEKVILVTHSMGGLVARWASEIVGAKSSILGIIHGVQPSTGATAAYWRMKAGFEGSTSSSLVLGYNAHEVTCILGNIPGGLSLLPNKLHRTNAGGARWLRVIQDGSVAVNLPSSERFPNPYEDIYKVPAVVTPQNDAAPSTNKYWGLVDPDLLDPDNLLGSSQEGLSGYDSIDARIGRTPWDAYRRQLAVAEQTHEELRDKHHPVTFCSQGDHFNGDNPHTADEIELWVEPRSRITVRNYPGQGFRGFLRGSGGERLQATLQEPNARGDGTVPLSSSGFLNKFATRDPRHTAEPVEHQPAYENGDIQNFTKAAIASLCLKRLEEPNG